MNVKIDILAISDLITSLEKDNENIKNNIKDINNIIKSIDKNSLNFKNKNKLDNQMSEYIKKLELKFFMNLDRCTSLLKSSVSKYENVNITNSKDILESDEIESLFER